MTNQDISRVDQTLVKPISQTASAVPAGVTLRDPAAPSLESPRHDSQEFVQRVGQLPLAEREAVTLFYFERWPLDRVAATMNRTPEQIAELLLAAAGVLRGDASERL